MPAVKTFENIFVAGGICSHMWEQSGGTVSQAVPAALSQVGRRHMRTRLNN